MVARAARKEGETERQRSLDFGGRPSARPAASVVRAIEDEGFPFEVLSDIAEAESWRKEVHRPIYYIHKWWARRLGTVFRAIVLASLSPKGSDVLRMFYEPTKLPGSVVFDPFMGSGTTLGETLKLGARAIGRDINPVAYFLVRNALGEHARDKVEAEFARLQREVAPSIRHFYEARLPDGTRCQVLYYFWVKQVACPSCGKDVDLFGSRIFSQNAYPKRVPRAQATCPGCGEVNETTYNATSVTCRSCSLDFNPQEGPAKGQKATCPSCQHSFSIAKVVQKQAKPPKHRLYAKLVLTDDGEKRYLAADDFDHALYAEAEAALGEREGAFPVVALEPGFNTDQALGYGYRTWDQFFNARQLLCLSLLADGIRKIEDRSTRELFGCLFSGTLEFNNMFTSFKGEGTGAVRHMFAHHILKPERVPLEANLWGTHASSGSFSTLYESRILRALRYAEAPTEILVQQRGGKAKKVSGLSEPIGYRIADSFREFEDAKRRLYLSCGDSSRTDIADGSVDAVVTDPPFYDNVHYSQLADFFYVWQRHLFGAEGTWTAHTTRAAGEVQDEDDAAFTSKLGAVLAEARRVLKDDGLLVFTYHHSRQEGWAAVLGALMDAGFRAVAAHPIKAEMAVAMPKNQAKEPIDLDIILVCRKRQDALAVVPDPRSITEKVEAAARNQVRRFAGRGRKLSRNDVLVIVMAQALCHLADLPKPEAMRQIAAWEQDADDLIARLHAGQQMDGKRVRSASD